MTSIYPLGQPEEEFGSEQRVLHLATVSKKGAVHAVQCNKCYTMQHEIEKRLLVAGTGLPPAKTPEAT
jgi:hypothetical protein